MSFFNPRIKENFYLYVSDKDCLDIFNENNPLDFSINLPRHIQLEGRWVCALTKVMLTYPCNEKSEETLFICSDFCTESLVGGEFMPVFDQVWVNPGLENFKECEFYNPHYIEVTRGSLSRFRICIRTELLKLPSCNLETIDCVLHFVKLY